MLPGGAEGASTSNAMQMRSGLKAGGKMSWKLVDSNEGLKGPLRLTCSQIEAGKKSTVYV